MVLYSVSSRLLVPGLSRVRISSGLLVPRRALVPSRGLSLVLSSRRSCHLFLRRIRFVPPGRQSCYSFSMVPFICLRHCSGPTVSRHLRQKYSGASVVYYFIHLIISMRLSLSRILELSWVGDRMGNLTQ